MLTSVAALLAGDHATASAGGDQALALAPITASEEWSLVQAACQQPAMFAPLYQRYRDRIYWYVRARTSADEDAADLTQHIFVRALDALAQYRPQRGSFASWLFAIARHTLIDFRRRSRPTISWDLLPGAPSLYASDDPGAALLQHEDLAHLRRLFLDLDPAKQEVLILRFVARLTIAEIATVIGKSEAATHKQLTRTLQALATHFETSL